MTRNGQRRFQQTGELPDSGKLLRHLAVIVPGTVDRMIEGDHEHGKAAGGIQIQDS